jgi:hypothetical protein
MLLLYMYDKKKGWYMKEIYVNIILNVIPSSSWISKKGYYIK